MKRTILTLALAFITLPLFAQETNTAVPNADESSSLEKENLRKKHSRDRRREFKKRQLKLMEKALNEIGVTDEQREQIIVLQNIHMKKMRENWKRMNEARRELTRLQDIGASMEELGAAIKEVSDAQAEQLHILVHNRKEMEKILGKEKNDLLMQKAHEYFQKHGRHPGAGMPPDPSGPPLPEQERQKIGKPPLPDIEMDAEDAPQSPEKAEEEEPVPPPP